MDLNVVRTLVKGNALFQDLDPGELDILIARAVERRFLPGEVIYHKGDPSRGELALIVSGKVHVVAESGYVVRELGAGELIGEVASVCRDGKRTVTLTAVDPTVTIGWMIDAVEGVSAEFLKRLKDLAWKRLKYYCE